MGWKTEFDVAQKESRFVNALGHAPDLLHPVINGDEVNFSHSGHTGDVIYAMPAMFALAKGRKINLYLRLNQPATEFTKKMRHPNGNVMLTEKSVHLFARSCLHNPALIYLRHWRMKTVHYDLSIFKPFPFDLPDERPLPGTFCSHFGIGTRSLINPGSMLRPMNHTTMRS
jgi:hypothetical protein